jgi:hypothetical protein
MYCHDLNTYGVESLPVTALNRVARSFTVHVGTIAPK